MADKSSWESFKVDGADIAAKVREWIHEGNVRRVIVEHHGKTIAEFPLTVGVVGVVVAPIATAIAALVGLLKDCTIKIERES